MILAGIVLFNPDKRRLIENISSIISQADKVILVDNFSKNIEYIENSLLKIFNDIYIIKNSNNRGIAYALNQILEFAYNNNYEWCLTLDQDSVASNNLIKIYQTYINTIDTKKIGVISCKIVDRNFTLESPNQKDISFVKSCITSGSLVKVQAWKEVGGFDISMFIDFVDNDFCTSLIEKNFKILLTNRTYILHELGHSSLINILGKQQILLHHSSFRYYYMIRNRIYYSRKHYSISTIYNLFAVLWRIFLILFYEGNKKENLKATCKGLVDGYKMRIP